MNPLGLYIPLVRVVHLSSSRVVLAIVYTAAFFMGIIGVVMLFIYARWPNGNDGQDYLMLVWGLIMVVTAGAIVGIDIAIDWYRGEPLGFQRHPDHRL